MQRPPSGKDVYKRQDEKWDTWAREGDKKHMVFVGLDDNDLLNDLSAYAAENGMTINYFNTACQTIRTKACLLYTSRCV